MFKQLPYLRDHPVYKSSKRDSTNQFVLQITHV